ncbi:MAG: hypothetical protein Q7K57_00810 [Burkholderiaceae bacterium]|nr:hypothetical protein [Polaromonas sp.]MDO8767257.1 hypothetical protein [Burkholderiaceae bacterium]
MKEKLTMESSDTRRPDQSHQKGDLCQTDIELYGVLDGSSQVRGKVQFTGHINVKERHTVTSRILALWRGHR